MAGDDLEDLPPDRIISLEDNGVVYCFDIFEVAKLQGLNPYTRKPFPASFIQEANNRTTGRRKPVDIDELKQRRKKSLKQYTIDLQDEAEQKIPYFGRKKFVLLPLKRLKQLALELSNYDPGFDLEKFNRELNDEPDPGDRLLIAKIYILQKLMRHPEILGNVLDEFLNRRF